MKESVTMVSYSLSLNCIPTRPHKTSSDRSSSPCFKTLSGRGLLAYLTYDLLVLTWLKSDTTPHTFYLRDRPKGQCCLAASLKKVPGGKLRSESMCCHWRPRGPSPPYFHLRDWTKEYPTCKLLHLGVIANCCPIMAPRLHKESDKKNWNDSL